MQRTTSSTTIDNTSQVPQTPQSNTSPYSPKTVRRTKPYSDDYHTNLEGLAIYKPKQLYLDQIDLNYGTGFWLTFLQKPQNLYHLQEIKAIFLMNITQRNLASINEFFSFLASHNDKLTPFKISVLGCIQKNISFTIPKELKNLCELFITDIQENSTIELPPELPHLTKIHLSDIGNNVKIIFPKEAPNLKEVRLFFKQAHAESNQTIINAVDQLMPNTKTRKLGQRGEDFAYGQWEAIIQNSFTSSAPPPATS